MFLDKPNPDEFSAFVRLLEQRALEETNPGSGSYMGSQAAGIAANVFEEPPIFGDSSQQGDREKKTVNPMRVEEAISMLKTYLEEEEIKALLLALEALKAEPEHESNLVHLMNVYNEMGAQQGAILTYAPYISILLSEDVMRDM